MTHREYMRRYHEAGRRLRAKGINPDEPIFFCGGRGCDFGRQPIDSPRMASPKPKPDSPDGPEKQD